MAYNRRSGGGGYGGYGSGGGYGGNGRFSGSGGGGFRSGAAGTVNPWQTGSGAGGPIPRQPQQGPPPAQIAMASNIISKLLTSSNSMAGSGFGGGPNRSGNWGSGGPRMAHIGMRQRQDGPGGFNKDNRRRGGDQHNRFSGGGRKSGGGAKDGGDKRKSAGKINDENKKAQNERERTKEQLDADKKASYIGVPSAVLYCHVCSKHMWDCESFEKHIRGRPHELMMTYLDEAYRMRVDFMRHQIKAVENQREIDLERVTNNKHKSNNSGSKTSGGNSNASKPLLRSYCPMCDVRFYGPLTGHRKSDRHRKLKQFLHPECKLCDCLFHTRLEMDEHKLTAGHLKKVAANRNVEYPYLKDDEFDLIDMIKIEEEEQDQDQMPVAKKYEMLGDRDAKKLKLELEGVSGEKHRSDKKVSSGTGTNLDAANTSDDVKIKEENTEEEIKTSDVTATAEESTAEESFAEESIAEESIAEESTVEVDTDTAVNESIKEENTTNMELITNKDNVTAVYDPNVAIGKELLVSSKGFVCRLCNCFLLDEQRVSIHCQTAAHYINYTTMTKMKEATSGGKKRGIDQVVEGVDNKQVNDAVSEDKNKNGVHSENVSEGVDTESEVHAAKRMKLDTDDVEEEENMEVEPVLAENMEEPVQEKTVEVVKQPAVEPEAARVVTPQTPKGRGGGRGRGGRGGVARRGARR